MTRLNQTVWFNKARECDGVTVTDRRQVNEEEYEQGLCGVDGLAPTYHRYKCP